MTSHFDHLAALIVGAIILGTVAVLQQRDVSSTMETTMSHAARARAEVLLDVVSQDAENLLTTVQAADLGIPHAIQLESDGERTTGATLTSFVRTSPSAYGPATVRYDLADTGRTVVVGQDTVSLFRVTRRVGTEAPHVVGEEVVDLDLAFSSAGADVTNGPPPADVTQVRVGVAVAAPAPRGRASDQRSTSETHLVRMGTTLRPINLPPQD
ncbi:MAG: hypothetical protein AAF845_14165 [Bacteroidota bacterium]